MVIEEPVYPSVDRAIQTYILVKNHMIYLSVYIGSQKHKLEHCSLGTFKILFQIP